MINLDRYEFSAEDNVFEKLDAKLGNYLVRSEEIAEDKHRVKREKLAGKYLKAKMKTEALLEEYNARKKSKAGDSNNSNSRIITL